MVNEYSEKQIAAYVAERNEALKALDIEWARKQIPHAKDDLVLLIGMHKARLHVTSMDADLVEESRQWLKERGYSEDI